MKTINLSEHNIRLFRCELLLQDYLWFSSYDISSISSTEAVIHNYALSYAISRYDRGIMNNTGPSYEKDLKRMDFYALPARPLEYSNKTLTYNAIDTKTLTTDQFDKNKNTPQIGKKKMISPLSSFEFYLFSWGGCPYWSN
ncbi:MAG: type I-D CRISPR-associated protein Cas5/Csc1 [Halanaerobiales bacterium]